MNDEEAGPAQRCFIVHHSSFIVSREGAITVRALAVGEAATHLPWLSPRAAALAALARSPAADVWNEVRSDPGSLLLLVRAASATSPPASFSVLLQESAVLEAALRLWDHPGVGGVDWNQSALRPIYTAARTYARVASHLAEQSQRCHPDLAWTAGLLAPLGWLAVAAAAPAQAAGCLADPDWAHHPLEVQQRAWGLDHAGICRRLCLRWRLPRWLTTIIGHLDLDPQTAQALGSEPNLFRLVQLAVALAERHGTGLHLPVGAAIAENAAALGFDAARLEMLERDLGALAESTPAEMNWEPPHALPCLRDLLLLALEKRRLSELPFLENLESEMDRLFHALRDQRGREEERLQALKLSALAEFAAGAGHEINNPLAVISGQAQYLLNQEADPARQRALLTIIGQAQRVHQILVELMQFARPTPPKPQTLDVAALVRDVAASLSDLAAQRQVRFICPQPDSALALYADPRQAHMALAALLRNAIEAAPSQGWAGVRIDAVSPNHLELIVEDNGDGPTPAQREHLFDPFYSGRQAGRGRGLGLPTAWRLARANDGDVRFEASATGPTRFVLRLPRAVVSCQLSVVSEEGAGDRDQALLASRGCQPPEAGLNLSQPAAPARGNGHDSDKNHKMANLDQPQKSDGPALEVNGQNQEHVPPVNGHAHIIPNP